MQPEHRSAAMVERFTEDDLRSAINAVTCELATLAGVNANRLDLAGVVSVLQQPVAPAVVLSILCRELGVELPRMAWQALRSRQERVE